MSRKWIALVTLLALVGAGVVVALRIEGIVRARIVEEAVRRGIALEPGSVKLRFGEIRVEQSRFSLVGVGGVTGTVGEVRIAFSGFAPENASISGVTVDVVGAPTDLEREIGAWRATHSVTSTIPVVLAPIDVSWRPERDGPTWGVARGVRFDEKEKRATASSVIAGGAALGRATATWDEQRAEIGFSLDEASPEAAPADSVPLRVRVNHAGRPPKARIWFQHLSAAKALGEARAKEVGLATTTLDGQIGLRFARAIDDGPVDGEAELTLVGWVPPHPTELQGFVFGDRTTLEATYSVDEERRSVALSSVKLRAGTFELRGGGRIVREMHYGTLHVDLTGELSCTALAESAAVARTGTIFGTWLGKMAKRTLQGSVAIFVGVDADSRDPEGAKISRRVGVGCGLQPFAADMLAEIEKRGSDAYDRARAVASALPIPSGLPTGFPEIPSSMPSLPFGIPSTLPSVRDFGEPRPAGSGAP